MMTAEMREKYSRFSLDELLSKNIDFGCGEMSGVEFLGQLLSKVD